MPQGVSPVKLKALDLIRKARTVLLLDHPFFGALIFRLAPVSAPSIPTMATDGKSLFYNPAFVEELPPDQLVGVLAHEVMHPALQHHTRRGNRNPERWNEAADYAINPLVLKAGLALPKDVLDDYRYHNLSAEQIYNRLEEEASENSSNSGAPQSSGSTGDSDLSSGSQSSLPDPGGNQIPQPPKTPGGFGQVLDAPNPEAPGQPLSDAQRSAAETEWRAAVHQAAAVARMAGKMPAGVDRALEQTAAATVDWRDRFKRSVSATIPNDYSWMRPNRRFIHAGLYLPGISREGVGELVVSIDCSGSISERQLGQFAGEVNALIEEHRPEKVHLLYFDTLIHRHDIYSCGEQVVLMPVGGGGTEFAPIFEHIDQNGLNPHALVILTDLYGPVPDREPHYPVIWVCTSSQVAAFGETISVDAA
jgi:predicted metal-dependent peptidase